MYPFSHIGEIEGLTLVTEAAMVGVNRLFVLQINKAGESVDKKSRALTCSASEQCRLAACNCERREAGVKRMEGNPTAAADC